MNLLLIGYRGTGKSEVGKLLAERLSLRYIDADHLLEERAGRSIAQVFAEEGEAGFRDREAKLLSELLREEGAVLSLGGGAVLRAGNRELIRRGGWVVWLRADPVTIHRRLEADAATASQRPPLTAAGGLQEIVQLLAARSALYAECADDTIDTDFRSPDQVADRVLTQLPPEFPRPAE